MRDAGVKPRGWRGGDRRVGGGRRRAPPGLWRPAHRVGGELPAALGPPAVWGARPRRLAPRVAASRC